MKRAKTALVLHTKTSQNLLYTCRTG